MVKTNIVVIFVDKVINTMIVNYYKMSGDELKRIYKLSELKSEDFAVKLGIERHQLYTQFGRGSKSVDADIEKAVKLNPDFAKHQQNLEVSQNNLSNNETQNSSPSAELWTKTLDMLKETIQLLANNNKFIQETSLFIQKDAEVFRSVVEMGVKQGAISFNNKATTKKA